jgi:hypothetical protein
VLTERILPGDDPQIRPSSPTRAIFSALIIRVTESAAIRRTRAVCPPPRLKSVRQRSRTFARRPAGDEFHMAVEPGR